MWSPYVEQWLKSFEVDWKRKEKVLMADIQKDPGMLNPVRHEKLSPARLAVLENGISSGIEPEALILFSADGEPPYAPCDGRHRICVFEKLGRESFDAYVVITQDERIRDEMLWSANTIAQMEIPMEIRLENALSYLKKFPYVTLKAAALRLNTPLQSLEAARRAETCRERLVALKCSVDGLTRSTLDDLGGLSDDAVAVATCTLIRQARLGTMQGERLIREIKLCRSEATRLEKVREWADRPEIRAKIELAVERKHKNAPRGKHAKGPDTKKWVTLCTMMRGVLNMVDVPATMNSLECTTPGDRKILRELGQQTARAIQTLVKH